MPHHHRSTRRGFLQNSFLTSAALALPSILPGHVLGKDDAVSPSNEIRSG